MPDTQTLVAQLFIQGRTLRINGDYDNAITVLQRAIAQEPNHAACRMELGLAYCFSGYFDESIEELKHATTLDQSNPEIYLHLAKTYTMLGMYDEGKAAFQVVLKLATFGDRFYDEAEKQLMYFK